MNYDKVENKRSKKELPRQIMNLEDDIKDVTDGSLLNKITNESLWHAPRNYVLIGIKTKGPMGISSYDLALSEIFRPKKPRQNMIRKAYVNHWYRAVNGRELSEGKLKEIANRMRHSVNVARSSYKKINAVTSDILPHDFEGIKVQRKVRIPVLENIERKLMKEIARMEMDDREEKLAV
jgi:hypothetical protein